MPRGDITDEQYAKLEPLLPPLRSGNKGHPYSPHRPILNGILWVLRTGAPWQDMPARYGPYQTCFDRFVRFRRLGLWQQLLETLQAQADAAGTLDWENACIDGSVIRAHQHAAGARIDPAIAEPSDAVATADQSLAATLAGPTHQLAPTERAAQPALGYSRGGFSTKIHLVCDGRGLPLAITLSPGQAHESQYVEQTLDAIRVPRISRGRPRKRPRWLLGDRGYTGRPIRAALRKRGIQSLIPTRRNEASSRKARRGQTTIF